VRMQRHATDSGVFVRSLATRGQFGGLTASTRAIVTVMDAMGKDVVIVETVGVGQDEVEVAGLADTTVVITVPGLGDDVQAIKAGILEVGDIFAVNKIDRDGASRAMGELEAMLEMEGLGSRAEGWSPPVVGTCTVDGRGLDELLSAMEEHRDWLAESGGERLRQRRLRGAKAELKGLIQIQALELITSRISQRQLDDMAARMARREEDPYSLCEQIFNTLGLGG
jgi:LAO/AO transport system kinase